MEITIPNDFKELLELLNSHNVEYMIVGAYALAFHGSPRFTGDLDIYVKPDKDNASLVLAVLKEFGFGSLDLTENDFIESGQVVQLGVPPVRIDLLTSNGADLGRSSRRRTGRAVGRCTSFIPRQRAIHP